MPQVRLLAAGRLAVSVEDDSVRVEFGTPDWLGPGRFTVAGRIVTIVGRANHRPKADPGFNLIWDEPIWRAEVRVPESGLVSVDELSASKTA